MYWLKAQILQFKPISEKLHSGIEYKKLKRPLSDDRAEGLYVKHVPENTVNHTTKMHESRVMSRIKYNDKKYGNA